METIQVFQRVVDDPGGYLQTMKEKRKIIGYCCTYTPEEIIFAASAHPVRLFGAKGAIQRADAHLQAYSCSLVRGVLEDALAGNLEFLRRSYRDAVTEYDQALRLIPGRPDAGDSIGDDAAWNRSIALRRIEDQPDAGPPDAGPDAEPPPDAGPDAASPDAGPDAASPPDAGPDAGPPDAGPDAGGDAASPDGGGAVDAGAAPSSAPDAGDAPPPSPEPESAQDPTQDERVLDQLEEAPTLQQQDAQRRARRGRPAGRGMADK